MHLGDRGRKKLDLDLDLIYSELESSNLTVARKVILHEMQDKNLANVPFRQGRFCGIVFQLLYCNRDQQVVCHRRSKSKQRSKIAQDLTKNVVKKENQALVKKDVSRGK